PSNDIPPCTTTVISPTACSTTRFIRNIETSTTPRDSSNPNIPIDPLPVTRTCFPSPAAARTTSPNSSKLATRFGNSALLETTTHLRPEGKHLPQSALPAESPEASPPPYPSHDAEPLPSDHFPHVARSRGF